MRILSHKSLALLGLLCLLVAAFFSKGFHHFDEHFQILEFAALKLGLTTEQNLPWEYQAKMRSTIQPTLVVLLHRALSPLGWDNPFWTATFFRLLSGLLSWGACLALFLRFEKTVDDFWKKRLFIPLSFFFSLAVYHGVRFSSENWGTIFFVFGLLIVSSQRRLTLKFAIGSGFLLGLSFLFRFQMGIMIFGLLAWTFFIKKELFSSIATLLMGLLLAIGLGTLIDHWFYGGWPITFWNYFDQNLIRGRAADFGVSPWYEYLRILFIFLIPPFSLFFILGLLAFFYFYPTHVFSFCLVPFLVIQSLIGHKEPRFIFPLLYFFPFIMALSYQKLGSFIRVTSARKNMLRAFYGSFIALNAGFLLVALFFPADKDVELYEAIYQSDGKHLLFLEENPYARAGIKIHYYQRPGLLVEKGSPELLSEKNNSKRLILTRKFEAPLDNADLIYEAFPEFITRFNFNHWVDRAKRWRLFWNQ